MDWDSSQRPSLVRESHHVRKLASLPVAAASSAYQICLVLLFRVLMRGMVARAYMGMASGSPCVIPSWESRMSPSTNNSVGARYVLMSMVASGEQSLLMFWRATWRFRELKAFVASTRRTASVSLDQIQFLPRAQQLQFQRSALRTSGGSLRLPVCLVSLLISLLWLLSAVRYPRCLLVERLGSCLEQ